MKEEPDGKLLVICRAGCSPEEIRESIGLPWEAFFPPQPRVRYRKAAARIPVQDMLAALDFEMEIVRIALADLEAKRPISDADLARFSLARQRIENAIRIAREGH